MRRGGSGSGGFWLRRISHQTDGEIREIKNARECRERWNGGWEAHAHTVATAQWKEDLGRRSKLVSRLVWESGEGKVGQWKWKKSGNDFKGKTDDDENSWSENGIWNWPMAAVAKYKQFQLVHCWIMCLPSLVKEVGPRPRRGTHTGYCTRKSKRNIPR